MKTASLVKISAVAGLLGVVPATQAQEEPRWTVGALGLGYLSPFKAENTKQNGDTKVDLIPIPYIAYRGERVYFEGLELGYHIIKPTRKPGLQFQFDVLASGRLMAGTSRSKITADAGLRFGFSGEFGFLNVTGLRDVTDNSNGYEVKATYGYSFHGEKFSLTPSISAIWQDKKMSNYMWGVTQKQQDKMVADKKPVLPVYQLSESVVNYSADLLFTYNVTDRLTFIGFGRVTFLDKKVRANPGIDKKINATLGLGFGYNF